MTTPNDALALWIAETLTRQGHDADAASLAAAITTPPNPALGDLAFPAFPLARTLRKAPAAIATELAAALAETLADHPTFASVEAAGPYVNVRLDTAREATRVLVSATSASWGAAASPNGRTVVIDYSSPNIAKPFGIGHLRSTAIGAALARVYEARGWKVVRVNHLGDWGTQFGKLMCAWERWGDEVALESDPIQHLYDLYVRFHKDVETEPALDDVGRDWFRRLEAGDAQAAAYWKRFRDLSLREFQRIYDRLGVTFDHWWGEAHYNDLLDDLIRDVEASGLASESEGALVVALDDLDMPPCLIRKSDGATLYATRDLAAARHRHEVFGFDRCLYVVGTAQSVHFKQVFTVLERMGYGWAEGCVHVPFGMILGISTRKGTLVFLEDILDRGRDHALEILADRDHLSDDERATIAEQVAIGAVVFQDLSRNRIKDYDFDWDQVLRGLRPGEPGRTGPYLQYTHVRLASVEAAALESLKRAELAVTDVNPARLTEPAERALLAEIARFPDVLETVENENEPSALSRYLLDLAAAFNTYYSSGARVVSDDAELTAARTLLIQAVRRTLARGLTLLGVPLPERM